jgi:PncC family amidohydrolase
MQGMERKTNKEYDKALLDQVARILVKRRQTIGTAESVTSGHLQAAFSLAENALEFYQGGLTAYNLGQKTKHLGVDPIYALECDCVSERTAQSMALGASSLFNCDWGIAITGYASPVPEKNIRDLFACFAISCHNKVIATGKINSPPGSPVAVCIFYTNSLLNELALALEKERVNGVELMNK